jgi:hypothetical protein
MRRIKLAMLLLLFCATSTFAAPCKGLNAAYVMKDAEGFSFKLVKAKEALAWSDLEAVLTTPTRRIEFTFTASNGYSINYMVRKEASVAPDDNESSYPFNSFDVNLNILDLPQSTNAAPVTIFAPELGSMLWYGNEAREYLPIGMWRLKSCK